MTDFVHVKASPAGFALYYACALGAVSFLGVGGCSRGGLSTPLTISSQQWDRLEEKEVVVLKPSLASLLGASPPVEREKTVQETAADALARIGEPAVPMLVETLNDRDPHARAQSARALALMGPKAQAAVPQLILSLDDADEHVRRGAARALGQIGPAAQSAVPALIRLLKLPPPPQ